MTSGRSRGRFITFEGGEGAGKSTQIRRLAERLRRNGRAVITTREPGGSPRAEAIRAFLLAGHAQPFGPLAEALLFAAARISHIDARIEPALQAGDWVLSDRFIDSTRVYQGMVGDVPAETIASIERVVLSGLAIDATVLIDVPAEIGLERAASRRQAAAPDRFEKQELAEHRRIRDGFLAQAAADSKRFLVVDGSPGIDEVEAAIWRAVSTRFAAELDIEMVLSA